jgi:hypothetical protein
MNAKYINSGGKIARSSVFIVVVLCFGMSDFAVSEPLFGPVLEAGVGTRPHAVCIADFNRDGSPDVASANVWGNSVSVLLGNGDGTFGPKADFSIAPGRSPKIVDTGDFNDDGAPDLLTAHQQSQCVGVMLGNGDGTFRTRTLYSTSVLKPHGGAIGDINRDGKLDILITGWEASRLGVRLGRGDGAFSSEVIYETGKNPYAVVTADFNGDGYTDCAVANHGSRDVSVLLSNRLGGLFPQARYPADGGPNGLDAADVDGDGKIDIVTANDWSNSLSVLLGNGNGTFGDRVSYATGDRPKSIVIADVSGDGIPDLLTANTVNYPNLIYPTADSVSVLLGKGDGTFSEKTNYTVGPGPFYMAAGDLNCDGGVDIVAPSYWDAKVYVRLNTRGSQVPCGWSTGTQ